MITNVFGLLILNYCPFHETQKTVLLKGLCAMDLREGKIESTNYYDLDEGMI